MIGCVCMVVGEERKVELVDGDWVRVRVRVCLLGQAVMGLCAPRVQSKRRVSRPRPAYTSNCCSRAIEGGESKTEREGGRETETE